MPKSLADGRIKFSILTTKPANPAAPTVAELNAGIDASCRILHSDFTWGATGSETVAEKELCKKGNFNALGASNYEGGISPFRYFNSSTGAPDPTEDAVFAATKTKGTKLWCYAREIGKDATAAWAAGDEIYLGGEVDTDSPQRIDTAGYIKRRVPLVFQDAWENIAAAA